MFTERFVTVPSLLFNPENDELLGKNGKIECMKTFNPMRVESYGESPSDENFSSDNKIHTLVIMQSGDQFVATIHIYEFEKLINGFIK